MVFWWRVRLHLSLLRSVDCLNLQRVCGVRWEAAAPGEACHAAWGAGAGMWPLFLGCLGCGALVVVAGMKTGRLMDATGVGGCGQLESCGVFEQEKLALCIEVCWDGGCGSGWVFILCFCLHKHAKWLFWNPLFADSKIWTFQKPPPHWRIQTHSLMKMHISVHVVAWECQLSRGQWWIWSSLMFHLSLSLYYQVVSLTEYHRRIDALNSEDLRSLCKRLQVP